MHLDLGKRMHKYNLKVNMSKIQGHGGIKDAATCTSSYLNYTVLDIVFVLYCQCYMCSVCSQQVQIYNYVKNISLYGVQWRRSQVKS